MLNVACFIANWCMVWATLTLCSPSLIFLTMSLLAFKSFTLFNWIGVIATNTMWFKAFHNTFFCCCFTSSTRDKVSLHNGSVLAPKIALRHMIFSTTLFAKLQKCLKTHVEMLFFICSHKFLPLELLSSCCLDHTLWLVFTPPCYSPSYRFAMPPSQNQLNVQTIKIKWNIKCFH